MTEPDLVVWMRPVAPARGKAPTYSREQIAAVAIAIADADGIDAVSMRRVAGRIGAGAMSLYRYVQNKDELYDLMVDGVQTDESDGASGDPRDALLALARGARATTLSHPWYPTLVAGIRVPGPKMLRATERFLSILDRTGLDIDEQMDLVNMVTTFATGFAQTELAQAGAVLRHEGGSEATYAYYEQMLGSGDFPYLRRVITDTNIGKHSGDEKFERALRRLVDSLTGAGLSVSPGG